MTGVNLCVNTNIGPMHLLQMLKPSGAVEQLTGHYKYWYLLQSGVETIRSSKTVYSNVLSLTKAFYNVVCYFLLIGHRPSFQSDFI